LLTWCLYLLSLNPDKEQKLIEEINSTLNGESPNFENTKNMPFLKAVLDETLRLWPPVPLDRKTAVQDDVLPCGLKIKSGVRFFVFCDSQFFKTILVWNLWGMGRMEEYYEEPLKFKPERWLDEQNGGKKVEGLFIPFMYGPRTCLGQKMVRFEGVFGVNEKAYIQASVMMCMLLQKFRFRHVPGHVAIYDPMFVTMRSRYGMQMYVYPADK
jgi:cytochrome P450